MSRSKSPTGRYLVTCGRDEVRRHFELGPALSLALTVASRSPRGTTAYVHDEVDDVIVGRVEHAADGVVHVYSTGRGNRV